MKNILHRLVLSLAILIYPCVCCHGNTEIQNTGINEGFQCIFMENDLELFIEGAILNQFWIEKYMSSAEMVTQNKSQRLHYEFHDGQYPGVCYDYHANIELYGGFVSQDGCLGWVNPHPRHPHKDKFENIKWTNLNPCQHISLFRNYYIDLDKRFNGRALPETHEPTKWRNMSPILKTLLENHRIKLQCTDITLTYGLPRVTVYRWAIVPYYSCVNPANEVSTFWRYYINSYAYPFGDFNKYAVSNAKSVDLFKYAGNYYFANAYIVAKIKQYSYQSPIGVGAVSVVPVCNFLQK